MCALPLLAGQNISAGFVVPTVAASVDLVVQLVTDRRGQRRVSEILGVTGRVEGEVIETSELFLSVDGRLDAGRRLPAARTALYRRPDSTSPTLLGSDGRSWAR